MNTYDRLVKVCNAVFEGEINTDSITPEASLRKDIGMNSIGLIYMAMAVEEEFGVKFTNDDFAFLRTVGDVVKKIEKNK